MAIERVPLENSQTLGWLLEEIHKSTDLKKDDLVALLKLIGAPANLSGLFLSLKNLSQVLGKARSIQELDRDWLLEIDFKKILETCNVLTGHERHLQECSVLKRLFPDDSRSVWRQLCGSIESYPLFSCLCFAPRRLDSLDIYFQLQAQILLSSQLLIQAEENLSDFKDSYLSVRKLSDPSFAKELLTLPAEVTSSEDYLALFKQANPDSQIFRAGKILQCAYRGRRRRIVPTGGGYRKQSPYQTPKIEDLEDYENPAAIWTGDNYVPKGVLTEDELNEYCSLGGTISEFTGGQDDIPIPAADERVISRTTLAELAFQGKQRSNQEALKNQLNPLGWNELNQFDLHILCRFLRGEGDPEDLQHSFLRDCLALIFWLSAPLERILRLRKFTGAPNPNSPEGLYLKNGRTLIARLHSPGPRIESQDRNEPSPLAYHVEHHCDIPLPAIAHTNSLLEAFRKITSPGPQLFEVYEGSDSIEKQIRTELGKLNKVHGTRLSVGRICHYWIHTLGRQLGEDPPSAMLFFGHQEKFSVARLHYTCAPAQRMEQAFRRTCSDLLKELGQPAGFPDEEVVNRPIYLGTPFCPRQESVFSLVKSLRQAVEQSRPIGKQFSSIKNFHNNYALYTACLIAFSTTYRAVKDPSLYEKDIHFSTGLGVISDKDDDRYYHSRFVWIPDVCRQQIKHYRRHLQRLYELFALHSPALFRLFSELDQHGRPLQLFRIPRSNDFLEVLRPGVIAQLLKNEHGYDLPVNSHRHYLKSELFKNGCPLEVIEAQLGHWEQGQEAWNRFSSLHPLEFCRQLNLHLPPILERDGWCALQGYDQ